LINQGVVSKIVDAGDVHTDDLVLEIGPGKGVLTERLVALVGRIVAVEKDGALFALLQEKFASEIASGKLDLIHGDILDFRIPAFSKKQTVFARPPGRSNPDLDCFGLPRKDERGESGHLKPYKLIANIPYNITGAILEKFLTAEQQPERMVLLVQKEVAERVVARDHKESLLSISVKVYGMPRIVARVSAGSFFPAPRVDSAVLVIENISKKFFTGFELSLPSPYVMPAKAESQTQGAHLDPGLRRDDTNTESATTEHEQRFFDFVRTGFTHKRKLLGSNLKQYFLTPEEWANAAKIAAISLKSRPEELSPGAWKSLFSLQR